MAKDRKDAKKNQRTQASGRQASVWERHPEDVEETAGKGEGRMTGGREAQGRMGPSMETGRKEMRAGEKEYGDRERSIGRGEYSAEDIAPSVREERSGRTDWEQAEERGRTMTGGGRGQQGSEPRRGMERGERHGTGRERDRWGSQRQGGQRGGELQRTGAELQPRSWGNPFSLMRRMWDDMDRLFENFGFGSGVAPIWRESERGASMWWPQVDVRQQGGELVVRADLPGMKKDDLDVEVRDNELIIRGERREEREEETREGYYRQERSYGSFYRNIPLPEGADADQCQARFENGVLEVRLAVPEQQKRGRRIEIGEEGGRRQEAGRAEGTERRQGERRKLA